MDPDRDLVGELDRGAPGGLAEAYRRHGARVYRVCLRLLGRAPDAEDATQEVFLKLIEGASPFAGRARFSTWLYRVSVNHCLHRLEKERLRAAAGLGEELELADPGASPFDELARGEARSGLEDLLARLTGEHRAVLVLREIEELSYRDIAAVLELPVGTVMSRLARARGELVRLAHAREPGHPRTTPAVSTGPAAS